MGTSSGWGHKCLGPRVAPTSAGQYALLGAKYIDGNAYGEKNVVGEAAQTRIVVAGIVAWGNLVASAESRSREQPLVP